MNINNAIKSAIANYQAGNLQQAEYICKNILKAHPYNFHALNALAAIYIKLGNYESAIKCFEEVLQSSPDNAEIYFNLGNAFKNKGDLESALNYYQKALQLDPNLAHVYNNIGLIFWEKGKLDDAITHYQKALQLNPYLSDTYNNLGIAFQEKGNFKDAITYYQKALQINPNLTETYNNIGLIFQEKGKLDDATNYYQKALQLDPYFANAYYNLGNALYEQGNRDKALSAYDKAIEYNPSLVVARFARYMSQLLIIYPNQTSIYSSRKLYQDELVKLCKTISLTTPQDIETAADAVGSQQPFYLAYQGFNDRELQQVYGDLVCRIMALRYPQFANYPIMPSHLYREPLRVGVVSGYFHSHSVWKIPIRGWIENIDKKRFSLYGYYTGKKKDGETEIAMQCFDHFVEDFYSFEDLCQIIRNDNLHVLIYPEIGMDPMTARLTALRLAPIQCTSLGHPDTSGLPTIDYYLSSDLMEPPDADEHYTEKLIRLPNLSIYYTPLDIPLTDMNRETLGLRSTSILYLCCQSLFKYLPQYDEVFPRIAQQIGDCQLLFISNPRSANLTKQFRLRVEQAFIKFNLNPKDYIVFLPFLNTVQYGTLNNICDVFLDSIGWTGHNSTFEAIACNLPVVTLSGKLMRARHTFAILTMMDLTETIANSIDDYISLAARLGKDSGWRKRISEKIAANKHRLYKDRTCITALEGFLETVVKERLK
ncbi:MAG: tetratricopeptide repeat protein [Thermodesulfovibrionales bacterium]